MLGDPTVLHAESIQENERIRATGKLNSWFHGFLISPFFLLS